MIPPARLPPLSSLRAFEAVARRASFKTAAAELSVTPSAVSHQIRQLEAHIGVRLLDRTPHAVTLTLAGQQLREAASAGFELIGVTIARIRAPAERRKLTLTSTPAFLSHWLAPRLVRLQAHFPSVDLRFHASNDIEPLRTGRIDAAIRYGRAPFPNASSHELCIDEFIAVCSPSLQLSGIEDLRRVTMIHIDGRLRPDPAPDWARWCFAAGVTDVEIEMGPRLPDGMSAVQAAIAGQGLVLASRLLVADAIAAGLLVQPFHQALAGDAYHFSATVDHIDQDVDALREWFVREVHASLGQREPAWRI